MNRIKPYSIVIFVVCMAITYALVQNFIIDPEAKGFLSHKSDYNKERMNTSIWLTVMYVHLFFALIALVCGVANFSDKLLAENRKLHKVTGYVYLFSVLVVVVTSGYMAPYVTGGKVASWPFHLLNIIWPAITITALVKIKKRQVMKHKEWMVRSFVFLFTNMLIHLVKLIVEKVVGLPYELSYTIAVYVAMIGLVLMAEMIIRTKLRAPKKA
ncbi:DUF2306 domain-containing protein [Brevibacillus sp. AG]|uniref:DUF2306 domain-containing protein n=1 Tax=Brevibacillus sp. AG TaxID=3020891 RepID=UPI000852F2FB|nr:DUF2306 domain-containing protein [Brevibacillus sp. AG]MDC0764829.1 DUF2306 domain-containing protein [Brevibacillus sp. AG]